MTSKLHKDTDWEFPPDTNRWVRNCDTINMLISQNYIPLYHLIYERVKYTCDTVLMVMS